MSVNTLAIIVQGEDRASGVLGKVGGALGGFGKIAGTVAVAGAAALAAGGAALVGVLTDCVREAVDAEAATAQLNAVLKSTGGAAGVTSTMANDLATSLSGVTRFGDEAILSGESMLLTFTNIGKDVFPATTEVMLDMSQALGQDLKSSAMQLGKALNDPIGGMSALQRVGVTFTDSQKAAVEAMMKTGDIAGAQKLILAELQKEFGGSAVAAGQTFAGQLDILNNALGNVKEGVGMALMPALTSLATTLGPVLMGAAQGLAGFLTTTVVPAISSVVSWVVANWPQIQAVISSVIGAVTGVIDGFVAFLGPVVTAVGNALAPLVQVFGQAGSSAQQVFGSDIPNAVNQLVGMWAPAWEQVKTAVSGAFEAIKGVVTTALGIVAGAIQSHGAQVRDLFVAAWGRVKDIVGSALTAVRDIVTNIITGVLNVIRATFGQVQTFLQSHAADISATIGGAWTQIGRIVNLALELIRNTVIPILTAIGAFIKTVFTEIVNFIQAHSDQIQTLLSGAWTIIQTVIQTVLGVIEGLIKTVLAAIKGDWKGAWESIKEVAETLWNGIKTVIETVLNTILGVVGTNLGKIKGWFEDKFNEIKAFLEGIDLGEIGRNLIGGLIAGIESMAATLVEKAKAVVGNAIQAAKNLLGIKSPSVVFRELGVMSMAGFAQGIDDGAPLNLDALGRHINAIIEAIRDWAGLIYAETIAPAKAVTDAIVPIFENLAKLIDGIGTLADLKIPRRVIPTLNDLKTVIKAVVEAAASLAGMVFAEQITPGKAVTDAITPIFDNFVKIIEGLKAMADLAKSSINLPALRSALGKLGQMVSVLVTSLSGAAAVIPDAGAAAAILAAAAGPVVALASEGLTLLSRLGEMVLPAEARWEAAVATVTKMVSSLMWHMWVWAQHIGELQIPARQFAENAAPVIALASEGLDLLSRLGEMVLPAAGRWETAVDVVTRMISSLMWHMWVWAQHIGDLQVPARQFAENAAPVIALAGEGLDLLSRLGEIVVPAEARWEAAVEAVTRMISSLMWHMWVWAQHIGDLQVPARQFAENVAPVIAIVKSGVDAFGALAGLAMPADMGVFYASMNNLTQFIGWLTWYLATIAQTITTDLQESAKAFAENAGPIIGIVKNGVDAFGALAGLAMPADMGVLYASMNNLTQFIGWLTWYLARIAQTITTDLQTAAKAFAENAGPVVKIVADGVTAFGALAGLAQPADMGVLYASMNNLTQFIGWLTWYLARIAQTITTDLQTAAKAFAENAKPVVGIVKEGVDAFVALAEVDGGQLGRANEGVTAVAEMIRHVVTTLGTIRAQVGDKLLADAEYLATVGLSTFKTLTELISGMDALAQLDAQKLTDWSFEGGVAWISGLADGMRSRMSYLWSQLTDVTNALASTLDAVELHDWGIDAGVAWITGLADGIRSGLGYLNDSLALVGSALGNAVTPATGAPMLAPTGLGWAAAPSATTNVYNNTVTVNNPVIRNDSDIEALATAVSERLSSKSQTYRRFGY